MSDLDPFALGGRQDGDEVVMSLFRQWIVVCDEVDAAIDAEAEAETNDDGRDVYDRWNEIEDEIMATPGGAVALAIKAYICIRQNHDGGSWSQRTAMLRFDENDCHDHEVSVLRNAAVLVPEIAELAASIIHEDAELIDADIEVAWARAALVAKDPPRWDWRRENAWRRETEAKLAEALKRIALAEAKTQRGEAIKARHASR
jgi:hypothetical protein